MNSTNYFIVSLLTVLLAGSAGCGFMGTEVGNGVKDKRKQQDDKSGGGSQTPESVDTKSKKSDDEAGNTSAEPMAQEGENQDTAADQDLGQTKTDGITAPTKGKPSAFVVTDVLLSTCGSVFSLPLASPFSLASFGASGETVAVGGEFVTPNWTLTVDGTTVADIVAQDNPSPVYNVAVNVRDGVVAAASYKCSDVTVSQNAVLPGYMGPLNRYQVTIRTPESEYQARWYVAPGQDQQDLAKLLRYEIRVTGSDDAIVLAAPVE